jgi:rhomboid protease GluP
MDLNRTLLWIVVLAALVTLARLFRLRSRLGRGWRVVCLALLAVTLGALIIAPDRAGLVAGGLWLVFVIVPSIGARILQRLTMQQQYGTARKLALYLQWLHPADGWREQPEMLRALALADSGEMDRAAEILNRHEGVNGAFAQTTRIIFCRINNQWEELSDWLGKQPDRKALSQDPNLFVTWLRALGEIGDLNGLLSRLAEYEDHLSRVGGLHRDLGRLMALSFCGRREHVERLLRSRFRYYREEVREFWLATADMAAGHQDAARQRLTAMLGTCTSLTRRAIERRLSHPLADAEQILSSESRLILSRQETESLHEAQFGMEAARTAGRPYATYALIALNVVMFGLELSVGGCTDSGALYRLGALCLAPEAKGEWWRILTSTFLHFGYLHLLMNMLGLYLLGPFAEYRLGARRYTVAYLISGMVSMLTILLLYTAGVRTLATIYVGASGSIMGVVGGTAAVLLREWRRKRSRVLSGRLWSMVLVVGLQVVFDVTTPEVSFTAHAAGAIVGFLAVALMKHNPAEERA